MQQIICKTCSKSVNVMPYELKQSSKNPPRRFCSSKCFWEWRKKFYKVSSFTRKKMSKALIGNKRRVGHKPWITGKQNIWVLGEKNVNWKGDKVGYNALHSRIRRRKGKSNLCEKCGKTNKRIHLANKSGKYLTDVSDWFYLCPKCHRIFDFANGMGRKGHRNKFVPNSRIKLGK